MKYAPKKSFAGEYKFKPASKTRRFVLNQNGETDEIVLNPPILPSTMDNPKTVIDFPDWSALSCSEILKAIEELTNTMMVIRVDQITYQTYLNQLEIGKAMYVKKCAASDVPTDGPTKLPPIPTWENLTCAELLQQIEAMRLASISIPDPITSQYYAEEATRGKEMYTKKCEPGAGPTDGPTDGPTGGGGSGSGGGGIVIPPILPGLGTGLTPGGGGAGGGGGEKEKEKQPYSWLWLILITAGVIVLTRKSKQ